MPNLAIDNEFMLYKFNPCANTQTYP